MKLGRNACNYYNVFGFLDWLDLGLCQWGSILLSNGHITALSNRKRIILQLNGGRYILSRNGKWIRTLKNQFKESIWENVITLTSVYWSQTEWMKVSQLLDESPKQLPQKHMMPLYHSNINHKKTFANRNEQRHSAAKKEVTLALAKYNWNQNYPIDWACWQ